MHQNGTFVQARIRYIIKMCIQLSNHSQFGLTTSFSPLGVFQAIIDNKWHQYWQKNIQTIKEEIYIL